MKARKNCKPTPNRNVFHTADILLAATLFPCSLEMSTDNLCCHLRSEIPFLLAPKKKRNIPSQYLSNSTEEKCPIRNLIKKRHSECVINNTVYLWTWMGFSASVVEAVRDKEKAHLSSIIKGKNIKVHLWHTLFDCFYVMQLCTFTFLYFWAKYWTFYTTAFTRDTDWYWTFEVDTDTDICEFKQSDNNTSTNIHYFNMNR